MQIILFVFVVLLNYKPLKNTIMAKLKQEFAENPLKSRQELIKY